MLDQVQADLRTEALNLSSEHIQRSMYFDGLVKHVGKLDPDVPPDKRLVSNIHELLEMLRPII